MIMEDIDERDKNFRKDVHTEVQKTGTQVDTVTPPDETTISIISGLGDVVEESAEAVGATIGDVLRPAMGGSVVGTTNGNKEEIEISQKRLKGKAGEEGEVVDRGSNANTK